MSNADITIARSECQRPTTFGCSEEFLELVSIIMQENSLTAPLNAADAKFLYLTLVQEIESLLSLDISVSTYKSFKTFSLYFYFFNFFFSLK